MTDPSSAPDEPPLGTPTPTSSAESDVPLDANGLRPAPAVPGPGWTLAMVRVDSEADYDPEVAGSRLLLLEPSGEPHQLGAWTDAGGGPDVVVDWTGDRALLLGTPLGDDGFDTTEWWLVDLATADVARVARHDFSWAGLTRPTGRNLVERREADGGGASLVRVGPDGSVIATLATFPASDRYVGEPAWLYGPDGTTVVVGGNGRFEVVTNAGEVVQTLDDAGQRACFPVRWWDDATVLARCVIEGGEDNGTYHRLWLVPIDGGSATALTAAPDEPPIVVDFGHVDALQVAGRTFAQWSGDCGAAQIDEVGADGRTRRLDLGTGQGAYLLGAHDGRLVVHVTDECAGGGGLATVDLDGGDLRWLWQPGPADFGVDAAITLR